MAENEQLIYMKKSTYEGALRAINEQLDETAYYKATELEGKIRAIGTRDTLAEYLAEQVEAIVYYGDSIRSYVFYKDTSVKNFEAPNLTSIPEAAFNWSNIRSIKCENVTTVQAGVQFDSCKYLSDIYFPSLNSCSGTATFRHCTALTKVEFPLVKSVTGYQCFYACTSLESVVLMSCTAISAGQGFIGCNAFKTLVIGTPNCTLSATTILPTDFLERGEIYLPDEAIDTYYKTATNWSYYAEIMKPISELPEEMRKWLEQTF